MDLKVTEKQEVRQPHGSEYVLTPNIIDIYPDLQEDDNGVEYLMNAKLNEAGMDILEQEASLASIWQRGQDPLAPEIGNRWSEALHEECNVLELMSDIEISVVSVSSACSVQFDIVEDALGQSYLSYKLQVVA